MTDVPESTLARALVAAQSQMPTVGKDSENLHFHSRFTSLDSLIAATRPILNQFGLAITQFPGMDDEGRPVLRTTLWHGPSGEKQQDVTPLYLSQQSSQAHGSATTYARRYAWAALLGIASEEDTDGEPAQPKPAEKPAAEKPVRMATKPQKTKMGILVKELAAEGAPFPVGFTGDSWVEVLREHLQQRYEVTTRTDLTAAQASELIDWLEEQKVPF